MLCAVVLVIASSGGGQEASPLKLPRDECVEPTATPALSMDLLIKGLPPVGAEVRLDQGVWREHSFVAELRRRLLAGQKLSSSQWAEAIRQSRAFSVRTRWPINE